MRTVRLRLHWTIRLYTYSSLFTVNVVEQKQHSVSRFVRFFKGIKPILYFYTIYHRVHTTVFEIGCKWLFD